MVRDIVRIYPYAATPQPHAGWYRVSGGISFGRRGQHLVSKGKGPNGPLRKSVNYTLKTKVADSRVIA